MSYKLGFATLTPLGAKVAEKLHGTWGNSTGYEIALAYLDLAVGTAIALEKTEAQFQTDIEMLLKARRDRNGPDFKVVS